jgi:hypothetical protein
MGGCILLCLLFQGSGWLTEKISTSKYPAYCLYIYMERCHHFGEFANTEDESQNDVKTVRVTE